MCHYCHTWPLLQVDLTNGKQEFSCNIEFDQHSKFEKYTLLLKARSTLENWNETGGAVEDMEIWGSREMRGTREILNPRGQEFRCFGNYSWHWRLWGIACWLHWIQSKNGELISNVKELVENSLAAHSPSHPHNCCRQQWQPPTHPSLLHLWQQQ